MGGKEKRKEGGWAGGGGRDGMGPGFKGWRDHQPRRVSFGSELIRGNNMHIPFQLKLFKKKKRRRGATVINCLRVRFKGVT